jgi:hypothetical protein
MKKGLFPLIPFLGFPEAQGLEISLLNHLSPDIYPGSCMFGKVCFVPPYPQRQSNGTSGPLDCLLGNLCIYIIYIYIYIYAEYRKLPNSHGTCIQAAPSSPGEQQKSIPKINQIWAMHRDASILDVLNVLAVDRLSLVFNVLAVEGPCNETRRYLCIMHLRQATRRVAICAHCTCCRRTDLGFQYIIHQMPLFNHFRSMLYRAIFIYTSVAIWLKNRKARRPRGHLVV